MTFAPVWPDGRVSVILLPAGERGERILDIVEQWMAGWLITPALWVLPSDVPIVDTQRPPEMRAVVIGRGRSGQPERRDVELLWALGSQEFKLVRLIAARTEAPKQEADEFARAALQLRRYLDFALPRQTEINKEEPPGADLLCLNLVFAPTQAAQYSLELLTSGWDANILVAGEDRPTPLSIDAFVTDGPRYDGFILANIAAAAGLWTGLPKSTYELRKEDVSVGALESVAVMQRVFVRSVISDRLSGQLALSAMKRAAGVDAGSGFEGIDDGEVQTIAPHDESRRLDELLATAVKGHGTDILTLRPQPEFSGPALKSEGIFNTIWRRIGIGVRAILALPKWMWFRFMDRIAKKVEVSGSDVKTTSRWKMPVRLAIPQDIKAPDRIYDSSIPKVSRPSASLWTHLRNLIALSIDSPPDLPKELTLVKEDGQVRLVFAEVERVLPDPEASWQPAPHLRGIDITCRPIEWLDPEGVDIAAGAIQSYRLEIEPGMSEAREALDALTRNVEATTKTEAKTERKANFVAGQLALGETWLAEMTADHPHGLDFENESEVEHV